MASKRAITDTQIAERRAKLIDMRRDGHSWSQIAKALEYGSAAAACQDLRRALDARKEELAISLDQHRQLELEKLDRLERAALDVLTRPHVHVSGGKIVRDGYTEIGDDGKPVDMPGDPLLDDGPVLQAIESLRRLSERRAKLLGIDAPTRIEADGELKVIVEGVNTEEMK